MKRDSANLKTLLTILSVSFLTLTVFIGAFSYFFLRTPHAQNVVATDTDVSSSQQQTDSASSAAQSVSSTWDASSLSQEQTQEFPDQEMSGELSASLDILAEIVEPSETTSSFDDNVGSTIANTMTEPVSFNIPDVMRGVMIVAGTDYLTNPSSSSTAVRSEIDAALANAQKLGMNSIILDTKYNEKVLFQSDVLSSMVTDLDYIGYLTESAKEKGFYVYATYDVTDLADSDQTYYRAETLDGDTLDGILQAAADFAVAYRFDGILLSNYYQYTSGHTYAAYLTSGGGIGFETYTRQVPRALLGTVAQLIRRVAPSTQVGLLSDSVWANSAENPSGTQTSASFSALTDGNADTRAMLYEGLFDFVMVKNYGSTTDKNVPFTEVAQWWSDQGEASDTTVYMLHASDRIGTQNTGWGAYEQLATQMIALEKIPGISGSAFNSLKRLVDNPGNATTMMVQYVQGDINEQYILSQLSMSLPTKTSFSTEEQSVTFQGASDPQEKVTINGEVIATDSNGYFSISMPLSPGSNQFVISHKSKSVTYTIERIVEVVKDVYPAGAINVEGGMEIVVTALAYENAVITASIGGQTVTMSPTEDVEDEELRDSGYILYEGRFIAPAAGTTDVQMGTILVTGVFEGISKSVQGATVTVNKIVQVGDGGVVQIVSEQAETFSINTLNNASDPNHYPLPKGTIDTTVGQKIVYKSGSKTYTFWKLASGVRVLADDIKAIGASPPANNAISRATISAAGLQTLVKLNTVQKVPYTVSYDGYKITFNFKYTTSVPNTVEVGENALFSGGQFTDSSLSLTFKKAGGLMGYEAYYENDNTLVLAFMNATGSLSGARIVVDPGHGGNDPGASGFYPGLDEREINVQVAAKLASILKSQGATVMVTTQGTTLAQRLAAAEAFNPHILVSIHGNSSARNPSASGTEVYYFYGMSKPLASTISAQVASALGITNRGAKSGLFYITRTSQFAAVLIEMGFVSNQQEYAKLINDTYQSRIASAIANSLSAIFKAANSGGNLSGSSNLGFSSSVNTTVDAGNANENIPLGSNHPISLSSTQISLSVGQQQRITVNNTAATVSWHSTNTAVATVGSDGTVTAISAGSADIVATINNNTYTCTTTVTNNGENNASTSSSDIASGTTYTLQGVSQIAQGTTSSFRLSPDFSGQVEWWTDASTVADIHDVSIENNTCVLRGEGPGQTVLYAIDAQTRNILAKMQISVT